MAYVGVKPAAITSATEAEIAGDLTVDTNTLKVDSSNNRVGIGTSTVDSALHVEQNASGVTETSGSTLKIHNTNASGRSKISLHNSAETASGSIYYDTDSGMLALQGDTGAGVVIQTSGNNERVRVDTSGNVGIGTPSPSYPMELASSSGAGTQFGITYVPNSVTLLLRAGGGDVNIGSVGSHPLILKTANTERMRIDSSGNLMMGTTSVGGTSVLSLGSSNYMIATHNDGGTSGFFGQIRFRNNANNADVGTINRVNDASVQYNTTSDARLKENIADMVGAIARVKQLAPKRYSWVNEELDVADQDGFLAHEAQTVVPIAVSGTQDEVDKDGDPVYMQMDYSKLVPLLTGALQEAITKIETLETEMTALKARVTALEDA